MKPRLPRSLLGRVIFTMPFLAGALVLLLWRAPDWSVVADAFRLVSWEWVVAAIALNLLSVLSRALAWDAVIHQALPELGIFLPGLGQLGRQRTCSGSCGQHGARRGCGSR